MSVTSDRTAIAAALDALTNVQGYVFRPDNTSTGDAWTLLETMERGPAFNFEVTYKVIVLLPPKEQDAMIWFSDNYSAITTALEDVAYVERVEPGAFQVEVGYRDCMILTLRKEA